ncbi:MAG: DUF2752 domain-containing protein [Polyangiaceae bacterium]
MPETQTRSYRHPARALAALAVSAAVVAGLWTGVWRCPTARIFHIPCPGCGSSRATRALLTGDFHGVLVNPLGPLVAFGIGLLMARAIWLEYVDGHTRRLDQAWGALVTRSLLVLALLELALWIFRWFGLFGGPVPV